MWTKLDRRTVLISGAGLAVSAILPSDARGAERAEVRMATGLRATAQSIAWIGTEAGIFRKHDLEVTFAKLEVGGPETTAGLTRGDWDFAQTGTVPIAEAVLKGDDPVILLRNHVPSVGIIIKTRRELSGLDQLAGKTVGVLTDAYSGQTGVITRLAIEKAGATATYRGLGTYQNIYAALIASEIDAGALPIDYRFVGQAQYGWNVFDTSVFGVPSIFATRRKTIAERRDVALRMVRGFVESIHLFKTRPDIVVPLLQRFLGFDDRKAVEDLQAYYVSLFPKVPRPDLSGGMEEIRTLFAKRYPAAQNLQEKDIADSTIIDEVERSGFIDLLYAADSKR
jgi:ABC-type nitrate/sulfonate/bicarbonate transport system substrate-binding protein